MVNIAMLRFDLRLYGALLQELAVAEKHIPLQNLNAEQRTLRGSYITELAAGSTLLHSDLSDETTSWFETMLVRLYLKPRKLENHTHKHTWMYMLELEEMPLAARRDATTDETFSWWDRYTDPIGYLLYDITRPTHSHFHERIEHLDGMITLVNVAAQIIRRDLRGSAITTYLPEIDAGSHAGYLGAKLAYDADQNELFVELPRIETQADANPNEAPPRLILRHSMGS